MKIHLNPINQHGVCKDNTVLEKVAHPSFEKTGQIDFFFRLEPSSSFFAASCQRIVQILVLKL
jgi:hypothetical protein